LRGILDNEENISRQELFKAERKAAVALEERIEMLEAILGENEYAEIKDGLQLAPISVLVSAQEDLKCRKSEYEQLGKLFFKASLPAISANGWIKKF
jgi:CRISPR/Cas system CMR-associated protein Cmr3 (group 5 of RAMP superfamily)